MAKPALDKRHTFEVPPGFEAVRGAGGRATGEVRAVGNALSERRKPVITDDVMARAKAAYEASTPNGYRYSEDGLCTALSAAFSEAVTREPDGYIFGACTFMTPEQFGTLGKYAPDARPVWFSDPAPQTIVQDVEALAELLCETFASADPGDDGKGKHGPTPENGKKRRGGR